MSKMLPENKHNPSPYESEQMLFDAINGSPDGLTLEDIKEIIDKENLVFYIDPFDTLVRAIAEKRITFAGKFKTGLLVPDGDRSQNQP